MNVSIVDPASVKTAGMIGLGAVGCGWAATYLALGMDVLAFDPAPDAREKAEAFLRQAWPSLRLLGVATSDEPPLARLVMTTLEEVTKRADILHENAPEKVEIKRELLAEVERYCRPDILIGSSSGGLPPSQIQAGLTTASARMIFWLTVM